MASRESSFHLSLHRPRLIMGIEKAAFGGLALVATFCVVAKSFLGIPAVVIAFLIAKWMTKKDDQFVRVMLKFLDEEHVYDSTPRISDYQKRPKGWGRGLPR
jgi:type IV secretory pathway VirB3-like protein